MKSKIILTVISVLLSVFIYSQEPTGYYQNTIGKTGTALQQALHDIIDNHQVQSYQQLWQHFKSTDKKANGKVWDMYSDKPNGTPSYQYTFGSDQCGSYSSEGDCYNREHSFPKSWFNDGYPMYTDLFHLYPTDGYVNGRRSNFPYGEVSGANWTSTNGSKVGNCSTPGYNGTVFEPIDEYKGDLARTYFYMATRYFNEDSGWDGSPMVNGSQPKKWALDMLMIWAKEDPVSQKEIDRNNAVYQIQGNRNPFIDHPEFADLIWGDGLNNNLLFSKVKKLTVYPNPIIDIVYVHLPESFSFNNFDVSLYSINGNKIPVEMEVALNRGKINLQHLPNGIYLLQMKNYNNNDTYSSQIIKLHFIK